jgi:hypothetical protein
MKRKDIAFVFAFCAALLILPGCRRVDWRDFTVKVPGATVDDEVDIRGALARYEGVDADSIVFDAKSRSLRLRYDSMKVAKKNIEMAIAGVGVAANDVTPESIGVAPKKK